MSAIEYAYGLLSIISIFFVVWRMNDMDRRTPFLDKLAWWCLGVGLFSELMLDTHPVDPSRLFTVFGISVLCLLYAQPKWRKFIADRRKFDVPLPPGDEEKRGSSVRSERFI